MTWLLRKLRYSGAHQNVSFQVSAMLIDLVRDYPAETITTLRNVRKDLLLFVATQHDPKKMVSFLNKCAVISIDEKAQTVNLGIPNEFVLQQVKKFFKKSLEQAVQEIYHPAYHLEMHLYTDLQNGTHPLQLDLKHLLDIKEKPTLVDPTIKADLHQQFGILFERKYRFDNFVVGAHNQLAVSAAQALCDAPWESYNPLFVYGGVGLGKTHLMQAIGNELMQRSPEKTIVYFPATKFIDEIVFSLKKNQLDSYMQKLSAVDVLMLDDVQFLAGKEKTQEIFHNIFNEFMSAGKQLIFTSDLPPKSITLLEPRLQSRLSQGLVVDIKAPDRETRVAILQIKLRTKDEQLDPELVELLANNISTNVRELEGALTVLLTRKKLLNHELTRQETFETLASLWFDTVDAHPSLQTAVAPTTGNIYSQKQQFDHIIQRIAEQMDLTVEAIMSEQRTQNISNARQVAMFIAKTHFHWTLEKIGSYFNKNHATVIYAIKSFQHHMAQDPHHRQAIISTVLK